MFGIPKQSIHRIALQAIKAGAGDDVLFPVLESGSEHVESRLFQVDVSGDADSLKLLRLGNRVGHRLGGTGVVVTHLADQVEPR